MTNNIIKEQSTDNLYTKIHAARKEIKSLSRTKDVSYKPGTVAYSYSDIDEVISSIQEHLNNHDLIIMSKMEYPENIPNFTTNDGVIMVGVLRTEIIYTKTGERESSPIPLFVRLQTRGVDYNTKAEKLTDNNIGQELSKAKTTARRTSIIDLLNLSSEDNDYNTKDAVISNSYQPPKTVDKIPNPVTVQFDEVALKKQVVDLWEKNQKFAHDKNPQNSERIELAISEKFEGIDNVRIDGMRKWLQQIEKDNQ